MEESVIVCSQCGTGNRMRKEAPDRGPVCGKCKSPLPWIISCSDISFRKELETPIPVLVDFWADWCAPCRMTAPALDEIARQKAGQIKLVKVNVDQNPVTAERFNIRSIPTMILFKNGQAADTLVGALSKDALLERLSRHLAQEWQRGVGERTPEEREKTGHPKGRTTP